LLCTPGVVHIVHRVIRKGSASTANSQDRDDAPNAANHPGLDLLLLGAGLIYLAFGATYGVADQHTFLVPAFVVVAIVLALGAERFLARRGEPVRHLAIVACAFLSPIVYALLPSIVAQSDLGARVLPQREVPYREPYTWFLQPWRCGYNGAERFARAALSELPDGAWLAADSTLGPPINYLQAARSFRRDVRLLSTVARQPWLDRLDESAHFDDMIDRGWFFTATAEPRHLPRRLRGDEFRIEPYGVVYKVLRKP
jgi:hypothetical protein